MTEIEPFVRLAQSEILEFRGRAEGCGEVEQRRAGRPAERLRKRREQRRRRDRVEADRMGQQNGVCFRVRRIEGAAERVAELVMQRHGCAAQRRAAEPGAVKRGGPRLAVAPIRTIAGKALRSARMASPAISERIGLRSAA